MTPRIAGFYTLSPKERLEYVKEFAALSDEEVKVLSSPGAIKFESADKMIENVVGVMPIPLGVVPGFFINNKEYIVPMATEQKSLISMTSKGAEWIRISGGFNAKALGSTMIGQIQLLKVEDFQKAKERIMENKDEILRTANTHSTIRKAVGVEVRTVHSSAGRMLIIELLVDVQDSMGANLVNSMCETAAPLIESLTDGQANLKIVSNLAVKRLVHVDTVVSKEVLGGEEIVNHIVEACTFAEADPYRAATHNKGILNAVSAVLLATNNDTRAVEAGAHAFAAMSGQYRPLSIWRRNKEGDLIGKLIMPMAVGIIGGAISANPLSKIALKILKVKLATELGEVAASTGLAYNLVALQKLVTTGIQN